jgi:pilus assembly protein CpaE
MPIVLLSTDNDAARTAPIEERISDAIPNVVKIRAIEDITCEIAKGGDEITYVLFLAPANDVNYIDHVIRIAEKYRDSIFFIVISEDISGNDYKRLIRTGGAEWVSSNANPREIVDITNRQRAGTNTASEQRNKPSLISFVPSAGGVGNSTLAVEVAVHLTKSKAGAKQRVCLLDLDFQTSHVCDYLDIQPRLQIEEISNNPERLDNHLFEVFVSHHSSGIDVFASPRSKFDPCRLNFLALDGLFEMFSARYDLILIDFSTSWSSWTPKILAASQAVVVTGINSIPGLRQIGETLAVIRDLVEVPIELRVAINRCELGAFGRVVRRQHVERILQNESIFYVRNDPMILEAINTGTPSAISGPRRKFSKDIAKIARFCQTLQREQQPNQPGLSA